MRAADEGCSVFTQDAKSLVVPGDVEGVAHGYDARIDLDRRYFGIGMMAVTPFGNGAAAQANDGNVTWVGQKHLERHHGPGVGEREEVRVVCEHLALDVVGAEMEG